MWKRIFIGMLLLFSSVVAMGQIAPVDTLKREIKVELPQSQGQVSTEAIQPRMSEDKPWLQADDSMPSIFKKGDTPVKKSNHYTLYPYNTTTPFNWDPVYKRSIAINKDTWRGRFWQAARSSDVANMGISGFVRYPASDRDKIHFENGVLVGDYATLLTQYFTSEFWRFRAKKNQKTTLQLLKDYNSVKSVETISSPNP